MQFLKDMLTLNPKNFGSADIPIGWILLCFAVGMIAATVVIQLTNATVYRMIKALSRHKCTDAAAAKDLKALGLAADKWVLFALKRENPILMRYIATASDEEHAFQNTAEATEEKSACEAENTAEEGETEKSTCENAPAQEKRTEEEKYYLSAQNLDRAKELLSRGEVGVLQTVGYCGLLIVLYFAVASLMTWILPMLF